MKKKTRHILFFVALAVGFGSCQAATEINDEYTYSYRECADGWNSPSIGRQGACSHHGGVVTRFVDQRSDELRYFVWSLKVVCGVSLLLALLWGLTWDEDPIPTIEIKGTKARVPLTIAGETRLVDVVRKDEYTYETVDNVALVACPEGRRKSIYQSKLEFKGKDGKYQQTLSRWIYTGRGRAGGYVARAFRWSSNA